MAKKFQNTKTQKQTGNHPPVRVQPPREAKSQPPATIQQPKKTKKEKKSCGQPPPAPHPDPPKLSKKAKNVDLDACLSTALNNKNIGKKQRAALRVAVESAKNLLENGAGGHDAELKQAVALGKIEVLQMKAKETRKLEQAGEQLRAKVGRLEATIKEQEEQLLREQKISEELKSKMVMQDENEVQPDLPLSQEPAGEVFQAVDLFTNVSGQQIILNREHRATILYQQDAIDLAQPAFENLDTEMQDILDIEHLRRSMEQMCL